MDMIDVSSSTIQSFGYDQAEKLLVVKFNSGGEYEYHDVPPETWEAFLAADSVGKFFHAKIRGKFGYGKRPPPPTEQEGPPAE